MKIVIIGAGSVYTPELLDGLLANRDTLPVREVALVDLDRERLSVMVGFCRRYTAHIGLNVSLWATAERREALPGADFVYTQIRVGGNAARMLDEAIPVRFGLIGQETTGSGGMMKALRTVPQMVAIAHDVMELCPQAWIINYTNPTGMVVEAVIRDTGAKIAGLCAGGFFPRDWAVGALGVDPNAVRYDYYGLNHMNFARNLTVHGKPLTSAEFERVAARNGAVCADISRATGLLMSPYMQYYFHTTARLAHMKEGTRAEVVIGLEREIYAVLADESCHQKPEAMGRRGGGGYSEVAMAVMRAIWRDTPTWIVANVPNRGVLSFLPPYAVIETPCLVDGRGLTPLQQPDAPLFAQGMISAVKAYEQLAVEAALSGSQDLALMALLAHPLARDYDVVKPMLAELLEANRQYLPRFFSGE